MQERTSTNGTNRMNGSRARLRGRERFWRQVQLYLKFWDDARRLRGSAARRAGADGRRRLVYGGGTEGSRLSILDSSSTGEVLVHELGHWLGLYHTFEGGCGTHAFCRGDKVNDMPARAEPNYDGAAPCDTCPAEGTAPVHNFMNYGDERLH